MVPLLLGSLGDEKNLLITRVRTIKNIDITIPNSLVLGNHIVNYSSAANAEGLILNPSVTIGYDVPWKIVHELLLGAAKKTAEVLTDPPPFILQTSLDDFYVSYELNVYSREPNKMALTYSELHKNIQDSFNESGVEIMSPHYSALRDGNQTTVPEKYLKSGHHVPGFRISSTPTESVIQIKKSTS
ncbi:MAG: mechanosensitive ion channel [Proteobacteria bacterium]|nr:MAG: mechanosensitive ion channel [Pseudomonadota bacterium]